MHYTAQVSFVKGIFTHSFNCLQMRVLINGGNRKASEFYERYDLMQTSIQKRYSSVAAQYYRTQLIKSLDQVQSPEG